MISKSKIDSLSREYLRVDLGNLDANIDPNKNLIVDEKYFNKFFYETQYEYYNLESTEQGEPIDCIEALQSFIRINL
jgi:hypothetical protein